MNDELTLELNNPLTEEQWDMIEDVDFDHTDSITFHTKHGKEVEFVKRKTGRWIHQAKFSRVECDQCGKVFRNTFAPKNFCPNCGSYMTEVEHDR